MQARLKLYQGAWCAVWREGGKTKRKSLRVGADRALAEARLATFVKENATQAKTCGEIMQAYIEDKANIASIKTVINRWDSQLKETFQNLEPKHIDRALCRKYTERRKKKDASNWTIRRELGIMRSAVLWHNKRSDAVFELPPEGLPKERSLSRNEFEKLIQGARSPHIKLFIQVAVYTAGRMGAILGLTWDRVNFERGTISLATGQHKVKGRATVPMNPQLRKALTEAYKGRTCEYVIEHGGKPVASIKKGLGDAAKRAKLKDVSAHVLRHTSAVWMAEKKIPMEEIAQFMGHTDTRITYKHYAKYSPEYLKKAAKALGG